MKRGPDYSIQWVYPEKSVNMDDVILYTGDLIRKARKKNPQSVIRIEVSVDEKRTEQYSS